MDTIIRIRTAGAVHRDVGMADPCHGMLYQFQFCGQYHLPGTFAPIADFGLLEAAAAQARSAAHPLWVGNVFSSDVFYGRPQRGKGGMGEDGRTGPGNGDPVPLLHSRPHR